MELKKLIALLLALAMVLCLVACGGGTKEDEPEEDEVAQSKDKDDDKSEPKETDPEKTEPKETEPDETEPSKTETQPTEPQEDYSQVAGRYWLYEMESSGITLHFDMICQMELDDSYVDMEKDGTGVMYLTGEDPVAFTYDLGDMTLVDESGDTLSLEIGDEKITMENDEVVITFVVEGSDLLERPETNDEYEQVAGRYWLYYMYTDGTEIDYELICMAGMDGSYLDLNADGTGVMALTGEDPVEFTYDLDEMILVDDTGDEVEFLIVDEKFQMWNDDTEVDFVLDGSDLLQKDFDTEESVAGTYWLYAIESEGVELGYDIICMAGLDDSCIELSEDGSGILYLTDEDPVEFVYDLDAGVLEDGLGEQMAIGIDGEELVIENMDSGEVLIFLKDGSELLG